MPYAAILAGQKDRRSLFGCNTLGSLPYTAAIEVEYRSMNYKGYTDYANMI